MAGFRDDGERLRFRPQVPERDIQVRLRLTVRSRLLEVTISREGTRYELLEGEPLEVWHGDAATTLEAGQPVMR